MSADGVGSGLSAVGGVADVSYDLPRIVVGVDGSDHSRCALRWAAHLARREGALVEAVHAWQPPIAYGITPGLAYLEWNPGTAAEKLLGETVDEVFGPDRPLGMRLVAVEGYAPKVLVNHSTGAYLVVVGSRGRGEFAARSLGSVSASVAQSAHCPVVVVHDTEPPPSEEEEPEIGSR